MKKDSKIQIPSELIVNNKVKPSTTYLYLTIKMKAQMQKDNSFKLNMYSNKFLKCLGWTQPTFKRHLDILHSMGIVLDYSLPKFKPMTIHVKETIKPFIEIDSNTVRKILSTANQIKDKKGNIKNYTEQAIRLYYYYEDKYNADKGYAFPSYKTIYRDCRISDPTINLLNKYFKKQKILYIEYGKEWFIDSETGRPKRQNNRYIPLCKGRVY